MPKEMTGAERRAQILQLLREAVVPLSGTALGNVTKVSRQMVVQDIALLRSQGQPILATARGYLLARPRECERLFKVRHTTEQAEEELYTVVDLGGCVVDVMVNHRAYGKISAPLAIKNRRDVHRFMENIRSGKSTPLLNVTSGYHFHHVTAESEEVLDEIETALREKGFLADFLPYESEGGGPLT